MLAGILALLLLVGVPTLVAVRSGSGPEPVEAAPATVPATTAAAAAAPPADPTTAAAPPPPTTAATTAAVQAPPPAPALPYAVPVEPATTAAAAPARRAPGRAVRRPPATTAADPAVAPEPPPPPGTTTVPPVVTDPPPRPPGPNDPTFTVPTRPRPPTVTLPPRITVPRDPTAPRFLVWAQRTLALRARPRGIHLVTREVVAGVPEIAEVRVGLAHLMVLHTSASLALNENASPDVRSDLAEWLDRAVPDGAPYFHHTLEGTDDMPAHVKAVLTGPSLTLPVSGGRLALGTWQGIYLCEHRDDGGPRSVTVTLWGEGGGGG